MIYDSRGRRRHPNQNRGRRVLSCDERQSAKPGCRCHRCVDYRARKGLERWRRAHPNAKVRGRYVKSVEFAQPRRWRCEKCGKVNMEAKCSGLDDLGHPTGCGFAPAWAA